MGTRAREYEQGARNMKGAFLSRLNSSFLLPAKRLPRKLHVTVTLISSLVLFCFSVSFIIVVTIITVITFDDEVRSMPNAEEQRKKLKEAARDVTGSEPRDVFMIANLIPDKEFDPAYKKEVLKMLERALKCGELSVKMRQAQRESLKRSMSEPRGRAEKSPVENTEPPDYKSLP